MPMLALVVSSWPSTCRGGRSTSSSFCATRAAASAPLVPSSSTMNSSPPSRATVSLLRSVWTSRSATPLMIWSPVSRPSESLISLNRSRSTSITVSSWRARRARSIAWARRSWNSRRLGRPVSGSW